MNERVRFNLGTLIPPNVDISKIAFIDLSGDADTNEGRSFNYDEIDKLANGLARGLIARGLQRGDAVAIIAENSVAFFITYMGILRAGMIAVPINFRQPKFIIEHIINDSETKLIFTDEVRQSLCPTDIPLIKYAESGVSSFREIMDYGNFKPIKPRAGETAMLLYTSGSTGLPKGVMLSHEGQLYALSRWEADKIEIAGHRMLIAAPQYHMNALFISKLVLSLGSSAVLLPRFSVEAYIRAIERHKVTWLTSVPTMLALVVREKELLSGIDRSSVRRVSMGSAPLTEALFDEVQQWFPDAVVSNLYGTTEHGPSAFGSHPNGLARPKLSIGYPNPGMDLRLVGGHDDNYGILQARSVSNLTGYKNLPEKTSEVLVDGWYHTKDVMRRDKDGFYFIIGREDDMFVCNGENVFPADVEKMLETHDAVEQASVIAVEDPVRGSAPVAFIVQTPGTEVKEQEIQIFARENGPVYQFPRHVFFIDAMPLAGTNKIDRAALAKRASDLMLAK